MRDAAPAQYGGQGMALLGGLAERGPVFTLPVAREVAGEKGIAPAYLNLLLHRLEQAGWIERVKRGTYVLSTRLGAPPVHTFALALALVESGAVSGWSALNHHGLTEQIPDVITITTPRRNAAAVRARPGGAPRVEFVVVVPAHFFGVSQVWMSESRVAIFDRERALLDCFALPGRFGGLGAGLDILDEHGHELDRGRLVEHALQYGKAAVARRLGWALEQTGADEALLRPLRELPGTGYPLLDPTRPAQGAYDKRWRVRENLGSGGRQ